MSSTNGQQILGTHEQPARAYSWGTDPETIYKQSTDPAAKIPGMPPNMGELLLPQVTTFQGILSSVSRVYRPSDEALKHSFNNARFMLNDLVVTECLDQRRRSVCLLNWHLEPEDAGDARQKRLCADLTDIIERIPNFLKYREALSYAIWYGRYACQHRYRWQQIKNQMRVTIDRWLPVNGDKLVFRYDDGTNDYDPDQIGIRVGAGYQTARGVQRRWTEAQFNQVQPTDYGLAYFLNQWERPLLAIHRYLIEDGEYEDPMNAGRVQGLGIRSRIYWTWYQKQETLAWLTEYLERSALGMEVWYYPWGNNEGLQAVKKSAEERIGQGRNIVFVPRPMGDNQDAYGMERIEPGMAGAEVIERIVKEYFGHLLKRYILGQTMTTEAVPGSLGSGQGDVHLDTYMQIVRYDATNLEETLTADLVKPLQTFNFPWSQNVHIRFKIDTEAPDVEKKLAAWKDAYDMGMELKEEGLCDLIGAPKAEPGDVVLQNPEAAQGRRVKEDPAQGTGNRAQGTDFNGRSQVSLMGQDFIELMKILQKQGDEKQIGQELGVEGTGGQVKKRYAKSKKPAAGQGSLLADQPRNADGEFATRRGGGASIADEDFALTNRSTGKRPVADNHDKTRQTKLLDGLDALPGQKDLFQAERYAADAGERWITIGAHRGHDGQKHGGTPVKISGGKIVSGPKTLAGKTLKGLAKKKPHTELKRAIAKAHREHGFAHRDIADAIEFVHGERKRIHEEREKAKEHARKLTGLTAADISRLSNAGHDYASGMKAGGVTGERLRHFDEFAQEMAREYPELGLGDPDNGSDTSQRLWDVLQEGKTQGPQKHHEDTVQEAIDLLHANARYAHEPEEYPIPFAAGNGERATGDSDAHADPEDGERHRLEVPDRPLNDAPPVLKTASGGDGANLLGMLASAFENRGYVASTGYLWPEEYSRHKPAAGQHHLWSEADEAKHPRDASGEFTGGGGNAIALPKEPARIGEEQEKGPPASETAAARSNLNGGQTMKSIAQEEKLPENVLQQLRMGPVSLNKISNLTGKSGRALRSAVEEWKADGILTEGRDGTVALASQPKSEVKKVSRREAASLIADHLSNAGYRARPWTADSGASRVYLDNLGYLDITRDGNVEPHLNRQKGAVMGALPELDIEPSGDRSGFKPVPTEPPDDPLERMEWEQDRNRLHDPLERG